MIICGLKLTHDGALALINNGKLEFCIEMEKIRNNPRYTSIEDVTTIQEILEDQGYEISDIDYFAIDGWGGTDQDALAIQPRLKIGEKNNLLSIMNEGVKSELGVAPYREKNLSDNVLQEWSFNDLIIQQRKIEYKSYLHVTGHLMSTYCTSPFAKANESAYQLVWDGGMFPRLYFIDPKNEKIENLGPLFFLIGNIYTIFSQHFGPFKASNNFAKDDLSIAGKVMAYISLGSLKKDLYEYFDDIYTNNYDAPMGFANIFANEFKKRIEGKGYTDEDILLTFHTYLEEMLINKLKKKISRHKHRSANLCLSGGCALNIKWNSAIRNSGIVKQVYVSPFPNDSGSAIGVACATMINQTNTWSLDWNVYSGPIISKTKILEGWHQIDYSIADLAKLLHEKQEPVVFLNGKAELGPRALGNRSILASASSLKMKKMLNDVKIREQYRPISPICKEDKASDIFDPGGKDPFMLFDHLVKKDWLDVIPAVVHLDDTGRLQTVAESDNSLIYELLSEYEAISGLPLLCNTSANYNGSGFFPNVYSAMEWGRVNYVYSEGTLYKKDDMIDFYKSEKLEAVEN